MFRVSYNIFCFYPKIKQISFTREFRQGLKPLSPPRAPPQAFSSDQAEYFGAHFARGTLHRVGWKTRSNLTEGDAGTS